MATPPPSIFQRAVRLADGAEQFCCPLKLVHGSDWPIPVFAPLAMTGLTGLRFYGESNWLARDIKIKRSLGLEDDYWQRAAKILRLKGDRS